MSAEGLKAFDAHGSKWLPIRRGKVHSLIIARQIVFHHRGKLCFLALRFFDSFSQTGKTKGQNFCHIDIALQ